MARGALSPYTRHPKPHAARPCRYRPEADCFRLTDKGLWPGVRQASRAAKDIQVFEDMLIPCKDEREIFAAVGLAYVPPHMRDLV